MSSIKHLKQYIRQLSDEADNSRLPSFWFTDWLLAVIDKPSLFLITDEEYQLTESELAQFYAGIEKLQAGTPLAYLTGQQAFWSLSFTVNEHTLIPRPDTEVLVEQVLQWIQSQPINDEHPIPKYLLDLGTGSGCIAISLAHELKHHLRYAHWHTVALDVSPEALEVAKYNALINEVGEIDFIQSSWYESLPTDRMFDVIVSNPPYIDEEDAHLAHLRAEPMSALSAPNYGLADIEHITQLAPKYLRAGGLLALEHGFDQGEAVRQILSSHGFGAIQTVQDYGENDRVTLGHLV
ncbi:peptide chain release factor N(5)-glutamine methyltransferase [Psychrobacter sp. A3]|uniref:peptide chain release factor N(5)-glutamine methyltransferase n=1 Tax=Psychrobacter sp. A3 TaxID=2992754 RepID=UPI00237AEA94|nr:peptide chain release factor N(5)-glutamine methyltransferase [Psychrobacter sp. A3]MDE0491719.1 peptide chain release factor N(5)-glutamine methyltransferase [Psychrobacter sp. A3]